MACNSCSEDESLKVGVCGGKGGRTWSYSTRGGGIREIEISCAWVIDSLSFKGINGNSILRSSKKFGGGGGCTRIITIDWPREYLTSIKGITNCHSGRIVVESLYFNTNLNNHGPFGGTNPNRLEGTPFSLLDQDDREITGFFGRADEFIDAIGVFCKDPSIPIVTIKVIRGITMKMELPREVGPWGGNRGKSWDDGLVGGIQKIQVYVGNGVVSAIQCHYKNKDLNLVYMHGGGRVGADKIYKIELERHSSEDLVGISGFYGPLDGNCWLEVVRSISFYTNKGKYGPFGSEVGTFFNSPACNAKVVGFYGRSGQYLDAIGVHLQYS